MKWKERKKKKRKKKKKTRPTSQQILETQCLLCVRMIHSPLPQSPAVLWIDAWRPTDGLDSPSERLRKCPHLTTNISHIVLFIKSCFNFLWFDFEFQSFVIHLFKRRAAFWADQWNKNQENKTKAKVSSAHFPAHNASIYFARWLAHWIRSPSVVIGHSSSYGCYWPRYHLWQLHGAALK